MLLCQPAVLYVALVNIIGPLGWCRPNTRLSRRFKPYTGIGRIPRAVKVQWQNLNLN